MAGAVSASLFMLAGSAAKLTYVSNNNVTSTTTLYSWASQAIGTASPDRVVVVCFSECQVNNNAQTVTCTIGGVAATRLTSGYINNGGNRGNYTAVFALLVPSGTTATIALTCTAQCVRAAIAVYTLTGTNGSVTPYATQCTNGTVPGASASVSLATNPGGAVLAYASDTSPNPTPSLAFVGVTQDFQAYVSSSAPYIGGHNNTQVGTSLTVTVNETPTNLANILIVAAVSW
jgi:hypothetical protein